MLLDIMGTADGWRLVKHLADQITERPRVLIVMLADGAFDVYTKRARVTVIQRPAITHPADATLCDCYCAAVAGQAGDLMESRHWRGVWQPRRETVAETHRRRLDVAWQLEYLGACRELAAEAAKEE